MSSILDDCESVTVTEFVGPDLLLDEEDIVGSQALSARNVEYSESLVIIPRRGFTQVWNPAKAIRVLYNWVQQQYNRLIYLNSDNNVVARDLSGSIAEFNILTGITAAGMTMVQAGFRIYMSFFDANGYGTSQAKVWDGTFSSPSGAPNVENVFQPPLDVSQLSGGTNWGTFANGGAGSVTAGTHFFALVGTTWNGYQQKPGPENGGTFSPRSFVATGSKTVTITVSPSTTWPSFVNTLQIAMTTADNPNRWFLVPSTNGGLAGVARGSALSVPFTIDIDDVTLTGGGPTEITDTLFNLYDGTAQPHCLVSSTNRTGYIVRLPGPDGLSVEGAILVSEPNQPQTVTLAEHLLSLPENRDIVTGFWLGSSLFALGPGWTYSFTDNLRTPINWAPPREVSKQIGSPFIRGVTTNQGRGYAFVCDHSGLFFFDGSTYPIRALSYNQKPDWDRINFDAPANALRIIEDPENRLVIVRAPLDGATIANYLMVWDYTDGISSSKVKYCGLWNIGAYPGIGDIEIVQNYPSKMKQVWISRGDGSTGDVKRAKSIEAGDATAASPSGLYSDDGAGIDGAYEMLAVSQAAEGPCQQIGAHFRVRGNGTINVGARSFDQTNFVPLAPIPATMTPGKRYLRTMDAQSATMSYQLDNGAAAGAFAIWAVLTAYWKPWFREFE